MAIADYLPRVETKADRLKLSVALSLMLSMVMTGCGPEDKKTEPSEMDAIRRASTELNFGQEDGIVPDPIGGIPPQNSEAVAGEPLPVVENEIQIDFNFREVHDQTIGGRPEDQFSDKVYEGFSPKTIRATSETFQNPIREFLGGDKPFIIAIPDGAADSKEWVAIKEGQHTDPHEGFPDWFDANAGDGVVVAFSYEDLLKFCESRNITLRKWHDFQGNLDANGENSVVLDEEDEGKDHVQVAIDKFFDSRSS